MSGTTPALFTFD